MDNPMVATTRNQKRHAKIQKLQTSKTGVELSPLEPGRALYKTVVHGESNGRHEKNKKTFVVGKLYDHRSERCKNIQTLDSYN